MDSQEGGPDVDVESVDSELEGLSGAFRGHLHIHRH